MNKELPKISQSKRENVLISVNPEIFESIREVNDYTIHCELDISTEFEFWGIDGDSFVMFNPITGLVEKIRPPFGRSNKEITVGTYTSTETHLMIQTNVNISPSAGKWNWMITLSKWQNEN